MNIFQVLSQGKSRLHEPSMSAMLGYLLDSHEDHGLGDAFIRVFLEELGKKRFNNILSSGFVNSEVSLEEPYELRGSRKDIDIEVSLLDRSKTELHRIIIENKIRDGAANTKQLVEYYEAVREDFPGDIFMVFLTPQSNSQTLAAEYNNLQIENKKRIYWSEKETNGGVLSMIRKVLSLEADGRINPINEYMRHTLKAFIKHSESVVQPRNDRLMRTGENIGEITDEVQIETGDGNSYRVVRRDSSQIQVFNGNTGEKEVARHVLARYIDEKELKIPHKELNTRTIGQRFFEWMDQQR